jgi:hypothetical protein
MPALCKALGVTLRSAVPDWGSAPVKSEFGIAAHPPESNPDPVPGLEKEKGGRGTAYPPSTQYPVPSARTHPTLLLDLMISGH